MLKEPRKEKIIDLLNEKQEYNIKDLRKYFNISLATIHRDLNELEREGRVRKIHGGVILNIQEDIETRNIIRLRSNINLKEKIAKKAIEFIENDDCIFIDNSTTCYYFAKELSRVKYKNIVVVTNSYSIPGLFINNENVKIILSGGIFLRELNCFIGPNAINIINEFNGNKFFLSTAAISVKSGLGDIYQPDSDEIKRTMMKRSKESICLVDSNKFNRVGQSVLCSIFELDKIITDSNCPIDVREEFNQQGKPLIIA